MTTLDNSMLLKSDDDILCIVEAESWSLKAFTFATMQRYVVQVNKLPEMQPQVTI